MKTDALLCGLNGKMRPGEAPALSDLACMFHSFLLGERVHTSSPLFFFFFVCFFSAAAILTFSINPAETEERSRNPLQ